MADIITSNVQLNTSAQITTSYGTLPPAHSFKNPFSNGTGSNQADMVCFVDVTIVASGTPKTISLSDGTLRMPNGLPFTPAKLKEISVFNPDQTNKVTIGGGANPCTPWLGGTTPTEDVPPNSLYCRTNSLAGWTVTASSADNIKFTSAGGTNLVVRVKMTGTSA